MDTAPPSPDAVAGASPPPSPDAVARGTAASPLAEGLAVAARTLRWSGFPPLSLLPVGDGGDESDDEPPTTAQTDVARELARVRSGSAREQKCAAFALAELAANDRAKLSALDGAGGVEVLLAFLLARAARGRALESAASALTELLALGDRALKRAILVRGEERALAAMVDVLGAAGGGARRAHAFVALALARLALSYVELALVELTSALTQVVVSVSKQLLMIVMAMGIFGDPLSAAQWWGFAFCVSGVCIFKQQRDAFSAGGRAGARGGVGARAPLRGGSGVYDVLGRTPPHRRKLRPPSDEILAVDGARELADRPGGPDDEGKPLLDVRGGGAGGALGTSEGSAFSGYNGGFHAHWARAALGGGNGHAAGTSGPFFDPYAQRGARAAPGGLLGGAPGAVAASGGSSAAAAHASAQHAAMARAAHFARGVGGALLGGAGGAPPGVALASPATPSFDVPTTPPLMTTLTDFTAARDEDVISEYDIEL